MSGAQLHRIEPFRLPGSRSLRCRWQCYYMGVGDKESGTAGGVKRDISSRGRDMKGVLEQYNRHVKPAFDYYIAPSMVIEER